MKNSKNQLVLLFFHLLIGLSATAQNYRPLLKHFNEWHVVTCNNGCTEDVYFTDKDTLINGDHFHVLDGYHYISRTFLLREDTNDRQVFLYKIWDDKNSQEFLIYDFSLAVGDSVEIHNPISPLPSDPGYFRLDSTEWITLDDGEDYKFFYLTALNPGQAGTNNTIWVEGIGSLSLINTPGSMPLYDGAGNLSCFFNQLTLHYSDTDSIPNGCVQVNTDLGLLDAIADEHFKIYPNPANKQIQIELNTTLKPSFIKLVDSRGKIVYQNDEGSIEPIDVSVLENGLYFVHLKGEHFNETRKIIIQH
ncbi:T9SS type A sorting domain-containing protein [Paracrocinitomix mangrovi]|uniref:T9SS type A sorting domain-containing protein n=1 Tax=Paracrocinitomix mangrovi TaxID=2862509 RepID=UPI001C8E6697|nr:T9SS type A sorting domain-containing protein [Paracrocinitomix mangrovi]UKN00637.1 T9SS type A sorting domain-containing protein [Paracrocinitomix mangrovi]